MKVTIVGGYGYLGPVISTVLKKHFPDARVTVIDTQLFKDSVFENIDDRFDRIVVKDKRDIVAADLAGTDVVVDLAAVSNDPMGTDFEAATMEINSAAAINLAKLAKSAGVKRFIFASSCSIYGAAGDSARSEGDEKNPLTAYARSKWEGEQGLEPLVGDGFSVIALRFATACGWSPVYRADLVLNDFVITAVTQKKITVLSDGTPWRPLIHTRDIGRAVTWACQVDQNGFQAYNVGSNRWTLTIRELAESVGKVLNVPVEITGERGGDKRSYRVNFDKFEKAAPQWLPQEDVNSTVEDIKTELLKHPERLPNFREGNLIRHNVLRARIASGEIDKQLHVK